MKKWLVLLVVLCSALLAQNWAAFVYTYANGGDTLFNITAKSVADKPGRVVILGNAVVTTKVLNISADEMKYNQDTGEIEFRGNVRGKISK